MIDDKLLVQIVERLSSIEAKVESILECKNEVKVCIQDINDLKNKTENQQKEIDEMKESSKWIRRAIVTMTLGIVATIIKFVLQI